MSSRLASFVRAPRRWLWFASAAVFAAVPKCVLCVVAYATAGTLLSRAGGREICGGATSPTLPWTSLVTLSAFVLVAAGLVVHRCRSSS